MPFGLTERQLAQIREVCYNHPLVKAVLVFGSRAKGNYHEGSDLDLCLVDKEMSLAQLLRLMSQIEDLDLPFHCDVVRMSSLRNKEMIEHIGRVGIVM